MILCIGIDTHGPKPNNIVAEAHFKQKLLINEKCANRLRRSNENQSQTHGVKYGIHISIVNITFLYNKQVNT